MTWWLVSCWRGMREHILGGEKIGPMSVKGAEVARFRDSSQPGVFCTWHVRSKKYLQLCGLICFETRNNPQERPWLGSRCIFQANLFNIYSLCIVAFAKALTSQVVSAVVVMEKASKQGRPLNFNVLRTDVFAREIVSGGGRQNFWFSAQLRGRHGHLIVW